MAVPGSQFVTIPELAAHSQSIIADDPASEANANAALLYGELGVTSWISPELDTLLERSITLTARMPRAKAIIEVNEREGPILDASKITSVKIDGALLDASAYERPHAWVIGRGDGEEFGKGALIEAVYKAGFSVDSTGQTNMPARIKQAILITAADHFKNPDPAKVRERIGDWEAERAGEGAALDPALLVIPVMAQLALRGWRRPQL